MKIESSIKQKVIFKTKVWAECSNYLATTVIIQTSFE
jgi:hypothetical protein